jgi:hypothetical protein
MYNVTDITELARYHLVVSIDNDEQEMRTSRNSCATSSRWSRRRTGAR